MLEIGIIAFTTFFATIGPIDAAAMFAVLTTRSAPKERRSMALRGIGVATMILLLFAVFGNSTLAALGISLAALRTAGGILLLLIGIDMVFARDSGGVSTTEDETEEATLKDDIAVFPLAMPLIAGPGAMGAVILLMADSSGHLLHQMVVLGAMIAVLLITYLALLGATQIQRVLGVTGLHVISRVIGVLLSALAVQFIFDGIAQSGIF